MRRPLAAIIALAASLCATAARLPADSGKTLQNQRGDVSYQVGRAAAVAVGASSSVSIDDGALAITGANSLAAVILPDSSQVLVGANTRVQLAFFDQSQIATARFILYNGKTRFEVRHPHGALANYTFSTSTGQIAVRGTDGDIELTGNSLRVNVYNLSDPSLPVQVTTIDGRSFTLGAGQTLFAHYVNGVLQVDVNNVTQQAIAAFSNDFGSPPGPQKPQGGKPKGGGTSGSPAPNAPAAGNDKGQNPLAFIAIGIAIVLLGGSYYGRPLFKRYVRTRQKFGKFPMTQYCRVRVAERQIDAIFIGRVLENPRRVRVQRSGRKYLWGFIQEEGKWLRVITLPDGTVHNAFFDREFKFEDRVRPRH